MWTRGLSGVECMCIPFGRMASSLPGIVIIGVTALAASAAHAEPSPDETSRTSSNDAPTDNGGPPDVPADAPVNSVLRLRNSLADPLPELGFETSHYILTGSLLATGLGCEFTMRPERESDWRGGTLFDEDARSFMRLGSAEGRSHAATASDVLVMSLLAYPLVDAAFVAANGNGSLAWKMFMVDAESMAMTTTVLALTRNLVGRERPYVRGCDGPDPDKGCGTDDSRRSFMSGHTAMAFTAAGLICTHHSELDIYGGGGGDTATCVVATTAAFAAGTLRMMADKHYATDVLAGAAVGAFSGFILPRLLHYGFGGDKPGGTNIMPFVGTSYGGAVAQGSF